MATKEQVEEFLKRLKEKIKVFDIIFRDDRGKNLQTLAALEIAPTYRKQVVLNIEPEDYSEGTDSGHSQQDGRDVGFRQGRERT